MWYEKEPPNSILTWDDLVNKFVNELFPPSKTTHLKNEISRFTQRFEETFREAWERFKEMLRACPHHGFLELTQIDTFYNGLNEKDQDSLNAAAGGNLLIEIVNKQVITPATIKAVEKSCVICGGAHAYYDCIATDSNQSSVCAATGTYNQVFLPNRASNQMAPPGFAPVQNNQNRIIKTKGKEIISIGEIIFKTKINVLRGDFNKQEENIRRSLNNDMMSILGSFFQNQASTLGTLSSNTIPNPKGDMKAVTTRSGLAYAGPSIPTNSSPEKVVERKTKETTDKEQPNYQGTLMPKFAFTIKSLLTNKYKLFELAKVPLNENCSAMLLKKLPEKLGDPDKFLIPCDFSRMDDLKDDEKEDLLKVLKSHKRAIAWKITDIKGIDPRFYTHKILMDEDYKPAVQCQRRVNPKIHEVIKKEVIKLLDAGMIYLISDSPWVSPIHCVPKKGGMTIVANKNNELILTRLVTGWRVCIDYRKLNEATRKDHFSLPFTDQKLERLAGNEFYYFLDGLSGYFQIPIDPQDQEKTTFTCPYGTFAYRRIPFGLCNAPGHKISKSGIKVDRAKVDVIAKLPYPTTVKGVMSFLGHAGFYRQFIQHFSKITRPMTYVLEKETPFVFSKDCIDAFETLKKNLIEAPILVVPDWNLPFELICDASDFAIGAVLGQRKTKHFQPIHYASKTMTEAQIHYTMKKKEMLAVVYAFEKFRPYLVLSKKWTHHFATAYHPQASGQVEDSNRGLKRILERTVGENHASWSDKLDDTLWAFCTAFKTPIGCTPYKLVYGKLCHLPIKLEHKAYWSLKHANFNLKTAGDHQKLQLNELTELHDQAYDNSLIYKERTKKLHDSKIKNLIFNVDDQVLLFNSCLKIFSGKLKTIGQDLSPSPMFFHMEPSSYPNPMVQTLRIASQCLKTFVFDFLSRFTRASHPLPAISLGKSDILDHYRLTFICFLYA
nr:DNA-directed DNA polymerase [Tanacetum cinerariifolium]